MRALFKISPQKKNSCALSTFLALGTLSQCATETEIRQERLNDITQQADDAYVVVLRTSSAAGQGLGLTEAMNLAQGILRAKSMSASSISAPELARKKTDMSEKDTAELSRHIRYWVNDRKLTSDAEAFFERLKLNSDSESVINHLFSSNSNEEKIKQLHAEFQRQFEAQQPVITERAIPASTHVLPLCSLDRQEVKFNFHQREGLNELSGYVEGSRFDPEGLINYLQSNYNINYYEHLSHIAGLTPAVQTAYFTNLITRSSQATSTHHAQAAVADPLEQLIQTLTAHSPANFMVLGNGHYCGVHVFADQSFALFNSETGEFSVTQDACDLRDALCRIVSENFSMQAVNYAPAPQQSLPPTSPVLYDPALFAHSARPPQEPSDPDEHPRPKGA